MSRHTEGPWKYLDHGAMIRALDDQMHIADVRGMGCLEREHGTSEAIKIMDANGRLMAAAPDMLAALEAVYADADRYDEITTRVLNVVVAAIKKARGE